ncbi:nucleoside recognition domain-containing protein [Paenibacillus sp. YYML68]|uniref:nucleoside recognition domain-containing protein n=1 Tax=Paenibacillus sp. YYML68 TaxID=2909250 RepID=UPI0024909358|nr:nucleoside recognition domain-containing protein [Paenibacillus sp. YYML68]
MPRSALFSPKLTTLALGASALSLVVSIIVYPDQAFQSSLQGLQLWWKLVFPALLPFLIITELMRGLGLLHGLGALMEPLFRILFRIPGVGGLVMAVSFTAGMPAGAAIVSTLRKSKLVTRDEGERLLAASHLLSPIILVSVIGVGFLHSAAAGLALAVIHYGSALVLALVQRIQSQRRSADAGHAAACDSRNPQLLPIASPQQEGYARSFWLTLERARSDDGRTFGKLLGDAVSSGVQQLFVIGGCMMMFSVLLSAVQLSGIFEVTAAAVASLSRDMDPSALSSLLAAFTTGLTEPHLGASRVAERIGLADGGGTVLGYAVLSFLLAWGGFSTHAQVSSFTASTDLRFRKFLSARLLHGAIAFVGTVLIWTPLNRYFQEESTLSVWSPIVSLRTGWTLDQDRWWPFISPLMLQFSSTLLVLLVLSVFAAFLFKRGR